MSTAVLTWNQERDACVIAWNYKPTDLPLDPLNFALAKFYTNGLHPFVYIAYDETGLARGLLMADSMNLEDGEIFALFDQIRQAGAAATQTGEFSPQQFTV